MKPVKISELKAKLSHYLASVRRGEGVVVTDRWTPIARILPYDDETEGLVIEEPTAPLVDLKRIRGVQPLRRVNVVKLLRESRDQR